MQLSDRIGRRLKLQDLRVLIAVVQAGSMRKAAAHLNITQPSISRAIAELEDAVGVPLLDRNPQGIELTAYGRALLDSGVKVFDDLRQGVRQIECLADPAAGEVRIGCHHFQTANDVCTTRCWINLEECFGPFRRRIFLISITWFVWLYLYRPGKVELAITTDNSITFG